MSLLIDVADNLVGTSNLGPSLKPIPARGDGHFTKANSCGKKKMAGVKRPSLANHGESNQP